MNLIGLLGLNENMLIKLLGALACPFIWRARNEESLESHSALHEYDISLHHHLVSDVFFPGQTHPYSHNLLSTLGEPNVMLVTLYIRGHLTSQQT